MAQEVQQELTLLQETVAEAVVEVRTRIATVIHLTTAVVLGIQQVEVEVELTVVRVAQEVILVVKQVHLEAQLLEVQQVAHIVQPQDTLMFVTKEGQVVMVVI